MKYYLKLLPWQIVAFIVSYVPIYIIRDYFVGYENILPWAIPIIIVLCINVSYVLSKQPLILVVLFLGLTIISGKYYTLWNTIPNYMSIYEECKDDYKSFTKAYNDVTTEKHQLNESVNIFNARNLYIKALSRNVNIGLDITVGTIDRSYFSEVIYDNVFLYDFVNNEDATEAEIHKWKETSEIYNIKNYGSDINNCMVAIISSIILLMASLFLSKIFNKYKDDSKNEDEEKERDKELL